MKLILAALLLTGCAAQPLTFEQRMALAQAGAGIRDAGAIYANSVPQPQSPYQVYGPLPQFNQPFNFNQPYHVQPIRY